MLPTTINDNYQSESKSNVLVLSKQAKNPIFQICKFAVLPGEKFYDKIFSGNTILSVCKRRIVLLKSKFKI